MTILCDECSGAHSGASGPCSLCGASTNSAFQLCDACAVNGDECPCCRAKLNSGFSQADRDAIVGALAGRKLAIEEAAQACAAATAPIKIEVEAFLAADREANEVYGLATAETSAAYSAAFAAFQEAWQKKEGVDEARKAKEEALVVSQNASRLASQAFQKRRDEIDAQYGEQRKIYDAAQQTFRDAKRKAEGKCDLFVDFIAARHRLEVGYKMELERLEQS